MDWNAPDLLKHLLPVTPLIRMHVIEGLLSDLFVVFACLLHNEFLSLPCCLYQLEAMNILTKNVTTINHTKSLQLRLCYNNNSRLLIKTRLLYTAVMSHSIKRRFLSAHYFYYYYGYMAENETFLV